MDSGAHGQQDIAIVDAQDQPYSNPVDPKTLYGKCLMRTPDFDPTGNTPFGQAVDPVPPLYCGLDENHTGPHTWEQFLEGSLQNWACAVVTAAGYTLTWELQSGGPGGHLAPSITSQAAS